MRTEARKVLKIPDIQKQIIEKYIGPAIAVSLEKDDVPSAKIGEVELRRAKSKVEV